MFGYTFVMCEMNDLVYRRNGACVDLAECSDAHLPASSVRRLEPVALRMMRILVDKGRRAQFLAGQVEWYVCEHGHPPSYGQLEELLSFEVDGETVRLFSRSTIRWAILRWKEAPGARSGHPAPDSVEGSPAPNSGEGTRAPNSAEGAPAPNSGGSRKVQSSGDCMWCVG